MFAFSIEFWLVVESIKVKKNFFKFFLKKWQQCQQYKKQQCQLKTEAIK